MKLRTPASTHKKKWLLGHGPQILRGYLNLPAWAKSIRSISSLPDGGATSKSPRFASARLLRPRNLTVTSNPNANLLSRPKLDGLWIASATPTVKCSKGVVPNTFFPSRQRRSFPLRPTSPPTQTHLRSPLRISQLTVLGVVGIARRKPAAAASASQPNLLDRNPGPPSRACSRKAARRVALARPCCPHARSF